MKLLYARIRALSDAVVDILTFTNTRMPSTRRVYGVRPSASSLPHRCDRHGADAGFTCFS